MDSETRQHMAILRDALALGELRLYEHSAATFRWLMATLFAGNGGAIVALLGADRPPPGSVYALAWFAAGLIASLLMGSASCYSAFKATLPMIQTRLKVEQGLILGEAPIDAIQQHIDTQQLSWRTWMPTYLGLASLAFIIIGIATIAGSVIRAS